MRDDVVDILTGQRAGQPRKINSNPIWVKHFTIQALGSTISVQSVLDTLSLGDANLTSHLHLVSRCAMSGTLQIFPLYYFMSCARTNLTFTFLVHPHAAY